MNMFWNRKKKDESEALIEAEKEEIEEKETDEENYYSEDVEIDELSEIAENGAEEDVETLVSEKSVSIKVENLEQLAEFANKRGNGVMQFMSKKNGEVFELRDVHFRIAQVWGTVTMARQCSPEEYERVMLAIDLRDHKEDYYLLPGLKENEVHEAMDCFCRDNLSCSGKKYYNKPDRFIKLLKENDLREDWNEYTKSLVYDKLEAFCDENGIEFESASEQSVFEESEGKDGSVQ